MLPIFLGGAMGPAHPVWGHVLVSLSFSCLPFEGDDDDGEETVGGLQPLLHVNCAAIRMTAEICNHCFKAVE